MYSSRWHWLGGLTALVLVCLAWLVLGQRFTPPAQAEPVDQPNSPDQPIACANKAFPHYRPCEIIFTGPITDINRLVNHIPARLGRFTNDQHRDIQIRRKAVKRYRIQDTQLSMLQIVLQLKQLIAEHHLEVSVDPNRVLGTPWLISGSPLLFPSGPRPELARTQFEQQWAFSVDRGIGLVALDDQGEARRRVAYTGDGIRVGVFDTVPFLSTNVEPVTEVTRSGVTFTVVDPQLTDPLPPPTAANTTGTHGLFVIGLVYAVAPRSHITLVRVLDNEGSGTVFGLMEALDEYIQQEKARVPFRPGVINLSLGVQPDDATEPPQLAGRTLQDVLDEARVEGFVVVAAAGNSSTTENPQPAQPPASYAGVMGVTSVNAVGRRSCFANTSLGVAAPGGDGGCATATPTATPRLSAPSAPIPTATPIGDGPCEGEEDRDHQCLISFMRLEDTYAHYGYWSGTSFSTPLVSGLAALVLEQMQPAPRLSLTEDQITAQINAVAARIYAGAVPGDAALGHGRVDVVRTLYPHRLYLPALQVGAPPGAAP